MTARLCLSLAVLSLSACSAAPGLSGLWFFQVGPFNQTAGTDTCEENFLEASCFTNDGETETPDFTITTEANESNAAVFFELLKSRNGDWLMLVEGDIVLVGVETDDVFNFTWSGTTDFTETRTHVDGYNATQTQVLSSDIKLDLTFDKETEIFSGTLSQAFSATREWTEDDTGDEAIGFYWGDINEASFSYLESDVTKGKGGDPRFNAFDTTECSDAACRIKVTSTGEVSRTMSGNPVDGANVNAGQYFEFGNPSGAELFVNLLD